MIPPLPPCEGSGYTTVMNETAKSQRRWFHLTPERLLLALLPIWGVLFLAEHLRWLPKGYPVLLAVTSMVVILVLLVLWLAVALMFRRRFQYSLRSLLLVMLLASFGMSWAAVELRAVRRQKEAVDAVEKLGGHVACGYKAEEKEDMLIHGVESPVPQCLRSLLGDDLFTSVLLVHLDGPHVTDVDLDQIKWLTELRFLSLSETRVTDATLEHLGLTHLRHLYLEGTQVTDAGLEYLKAATQLQYLSLDDTKVTDGGLGDLGELSELQVLSLNKTHVTDAGLEHLRGLSQLRDLSLNRTQITDVGLKYLRELKQLKRLSLDGTEVTDAGLQQLRELNQLHYLSLDGTEVTDAGLQHLRELSQLQDLSLRRTQITDVGLKYLRGLSHLQWLGLDWTKVTDRGLEHLQSRGNLNACRSRTPRSRTVV